MLIDFLFVGLVWYVEFDINKSANEGPKSVYEGLKSTNPPFSLFLFGFFFVGNGFDFLFKGFKFCYQLDVLVHNKFDFCFLSGLSIFFNTVDFIVLDYFKMHNCAGIY